MESLLTLFFSESRLQDLTLYAVKYSEPILYLVK